MGVTGFCIFVLGLSIRLIVPCTSFPRHSVPTSPHTIPMSPLIPAFTEIMLPSQRLSLNMII